MAITYVTTLLAGGAATVTSAVTIPAATAQAGDILLYEFTHRGTSASTPTGTTISTGGLTWTLKHSQLYNSSTFSGHTYWTRATASHSGQSISFGSLTDSSAGLLSIYRGCIASGDPFSAATIVGSQNASGTETQSQITTTVDGAWVVLVVATAPDVSITSQSCTSPGALTSGTERLSTGGTDTAIAHYGAEKATAGATGAFTWAMTNQVNGSWAYALTPEPPPQLMPRIVVARGGAPTAVR